MAVGLCPTAFSITGDSQATVNVAKTCTVAVCPGAVVYFGTANYSYVNNAQCGPGSDTYLKAFDTTTRPAYATNLTAPPPSELLPPADPATGFYIGDNDVQGSCDLASFTVGARTYSVLLVAGCYDAAPCSGRVGYAILGPASCARPAPPSTLPPLPALPAVPPAPALLLPPGVAPAPGPQPLLSWPPPVVLAPAPAPAPLLSPPPPPLPGSGRCAVFDVTGDRSATLATLPTDCALNVCPGMQVDFGTANLNSLTGALCYGDTFLRAFDYNYPTLVRYGAAAHQLTYSNSNDVPPGCDYGSFIVPAGVYSILLLPGCASAAECGGRVPSASAARAIGPPKSPPALLPPSREGAKHSKRAHVVQA